MGCQNRPLNLPPCPVCGEGSAWMGSTTWYPFTGHACSDKCGEAAKLALLALRETAEYQRMRDALNDWQQRIHDAEHKAIAAALQEPPEMTPLEKALREAVQLRKLADGPLGPRLYKNVPREAADAAEVLLRDHADELLSLVGERRLKIHGFLINTSTYVPDSVKFQIGDKLVDAHDYWAEVGADPAPPQEESDG